MSNINENTLTQMLAAAHPRRTAGPVPSFNIDKPKYSRPNPPPSRVSVGAELFLDEPLPAVPGPGFDPDITAGFGPDPGIAVIPEISHNDHPKSMFKSKLQNENNPSSENGEKQLLEQPLKEPKVEKPPPADLPIEDLISSISSLKSEKSTHTTKSNTSSTPSSAKSVSQNEPSAAPPNNTNAGTPLTFSRSPSDLQPNSSPNSDHDNPSSSTTKRRGHGPLSGISKLIAKSASSTQMKSFATAAYPTVAPPSTVPQGLSRAETLALLAAQARQSIPTPTPAPPPPPPPQQSLPPPPSSLEIPNTLKPSNDNMPSNSSVSDISPSSSVGSSSGSSVRYESPALSADVTGDADDAKRSPGRSVSMPVPSPPAKPVSKSRSFFNSKSNRNHAPSLSSQNITPADFLPRELHPESNNWSLNSKYSFYKNLIKSNKLVGRGSTATVRTIQNTSTKQLYAVKMYHRYNSVLDGNAYQHYKRLAAEYRAGTGLQHRNVIGVVDLLVDSNSQWCCVMELCDSGDLFSLIEAYRMENKKMSKDERNCLFKQLLYGVNYLHSHGIVHRDIKPENLLLTSTGYLKISDLGVADSIFCSNRIIRDFNADSECDADDEDDDGSDEDNDQIIRFSAGINGSAPYISPEVLSSKENNNPHYYDGRLLDVWSCGIVYINMTFNGGLFGQAHKSDPGYQKYLVEYNNFTESEEKAENILQSIFTNKPLSSNSSASNLSVFSNATSLAPDMPPPTNISRESFLNTTKDLKYLPYFNEYGEAGKKLMAKVLSPDPQKRLQVGEILSSNYIKRIGLCVEPDPSDKIDTNIDATKKSAVDEFVLRNHVHKKPKG